MRLRTGLTGLYFIEGETVNVLNDGAHETHTVTNGKITLDVDPAPETKLALNFNRCRAF
ncbi:MAG: hypothetical protein ACR2PG_08265 [Hyphomicrobiaceae bacterium]